MYKIEREQEILKILKEEGFAAVMLLSNTLFKSVSSIRRDLTAMEIKGLVKRSYGGVELNSNNSSVVPFSARTHLNITAKKAMAKKAAELVTDGCVVFLDQSSSSFFVACELLSKKKLTVITNNVDILTTLADSTFDIYSSGGYLSPRNRNCLIGDDAHRIFAETHADILFFSASSLSFDGEISDCTREEVCLRDTMIKNAAEKIFLCDSKKFGKTSVFRQCSLTDVDAMVSEADCTGLFGSFGIRIY